MKFYDEPVRQVVEEAAGLARAGGEARTFQLVRERSEHGRTRRPVPPARAALAHELESSRYFQSGATDVSPGDFLLIEMPLTRPLSFAA
ncbi:MAG: hypothetical protein WKG07_43390 [Hymenobacter sp.]